MHKSSGEKEVSKPHDKCLPTNYSIRPRCQPITAYLFSWMNFVSRHLLCHDFVMSPQVCWPATTCQRHPPTNFNPPPPLGQNSLHQGNKDQLRFWFGWTVTDSAAKDLTGLGATSGVCDLSMWQRWTDMQTVVLTAKKRSEKVYESSIRAQHSIKHKTPTARGDIGDFGHYEKGINLVPATSMWQITFFLGLNDLKLYS